MRVVEEFGKTVEEAREKAFNALGIRSANEQGVTVEVLDEGSPGNALGWGRKFARIKVTSFESESVPVRPLPRKVEPSQDEELAPAEEEEEEEDDLDSYMDDESVRELLEEILDLSRLRVNVEERSGPDGQMLFNIVGPDQGTLIGKHGQTLDALQFIVNLIVNKDVRTRRRITLDAGGYRQRREKVLRDLAWRMSRRALDEDCQIALEPMNAAERRIVHISLADDPEVETFSEGEEPMRKVIIAPRR